MRCAGACAVWGGLGLAAASGACAQIGAPAFIVASTAAVPQELRSNATALEPAVLRSLPRTNAALSGNPAAPAFAAAPPAAALETPARSNPGARTVPEPKSFVLMLAGLAIVAFIGMRRR